MITAAARFLSVTGRSCEDAARIEIGPVTGSKAREFIHNRTQDPQRWTTVLDTITRQPHGVLAQALSTPWRLTLAVTVYDYRDPQTGAYLRSPDDLV